MIESELVYLTNVQIHFCQHHINDNKTNSQFPLRVICDYTLIFFKVTYIFFTNVQIREFA